MKNKANWGVDIGDKIRVLFWRLHITVENFVGFRVGSSYAGGRNMAQNGYSVRCIGLVYALDMRLHRLLAIMCIGCIG